MSRTLFFLTIMLSPFIGFSENREEKTSLKADAVQISEEASKKEETPVTPQNMFEKLEREKDKYPYLYVPTDRIYYKKIKVDTGLSYVSSPIKKRTSLTDSRTLVYPEISLALEYWYKRYIGIGIKGSTGFITSESGEIEDFFYYPVNGNFSLKYKFATEYSTAAPYFVFEIGIHYHDFRIEKQEGELVKKIYKGPYIGLEKRVALSEDFGFLFELDFMPYLLSSEFSGKDTKNRSMGIDFLGGLYFTSKIKMNDNNKYRLKLFVGFQQKDYFTKVENKNLPSRQLNQKYSSYFLIASQEF